jgi:hypothetical protein
MSQCIGINILGLKRRGPLGPTIKQIVRKDLSDPFERTRHTGGRIRYNPVAGSSYERMKWSLEPSAASG